MEDKMISQEEQERIEAEREKEFRISRYCEELGMLPASAKKNFNEYMAQARKYDLDLESWLKMQIEQRITGLCEQIGESRENLNKCFMKSREKEDMRFLEWLKQAAERGYNPVHCDGPDYPGTPRR